jgi:nucleoside-diphosphate-sugar epimerase
MSNNAPSPDSDTTRNPAQSISGRCVVSLTGASGFIGRSLLKHLSLLCDVKIKVLVHRKQPECELNDRIVLIQGDLMNPETLDTFISLGDTVINLVYLGAASRQDNITAIWNLLDACEKANIRRLIHCSTARVAGRIHDRPITERSICNPISEYAATKLEIERELLKGARSYEVVIVRPTAIFGPAGLNLVQFVHDLRGNKRYLGYVKSCLFGRSRQNLVYVDNVVSAIAFLITASLKTSQETFIISDDYESSNNYRGVEKFFFKYFGWKDYVIPPVQLPLPMLTFLADLMNKFNDPATRYDCRKIMQSGFNKPVSFEEGMSRFARWYKDEFLS